MKRTVLIALMAVGIIGAASAQRDDLYFVPKKKRVVKVEPQQIEEDTETFTMAAAPAKQLEMDEDAYNRRGAYRAEQGDAIEAESIVVITEDGDTMRMDTDTLRLTRAIRDEGWVGGFDGSDSDYEYAMRIVRFRNPRYAIPVSSPLYWDVVYGGALWPSWEWNVYDDGMYAYVLPTSSNWYYWDYRMNYPFGYSSWGNPWGYHHAWHWGHHWGGHYYGHLWYDPWHNPHFHGYHPGWHHGPHHAMHPSMGHGKPGWDKPKAYPNHRTAAAASTRRIDNGSSRNASSGSRTSGDQVIRRSTGSSSVSRSTATGGGSRTSSRSSYDRPSSTRSSSSSVGRSSSSSSRSSSSSVGRSSSSSSRSSSSSVNRSSSSSSRSSSYSSGSSGSSRSGSSFSSGGSSRSSSYSGGSSRGGGSYSGGGSSRSSGGRR